MVGLGLFLHVISVAGTKLYSTIVVCVPVATPQDPMRTQLGEIMGLQHIFKQKYIELSAAIDTSYAELVKLRALIEKPEPKIAPAVNPLVRESHKTELSDAEARLEEKEKENEYYSLRVGLETIVTKAGAKSLEAQPLKKTEEGQAVVALLGNDMDWG